MRVDRSTKNLAPVGDVPQIHEVRESNGALLANVSRRATGQTHECTSRFNTAIVSHSVTQEMRGGRLVTVERVIVGFTEVWREER